MSAKLIVLEQGTEAWHQHRRQHRNASETAAVLGVSPFVTPYQLWTYKTGRAHCAENYAMRRGSQMEATARLAYEAMTGWVMEPQVLVDGRYSASFDGMLLTGECILEIKCPLKGRESDTWKSVEAGTVPEHYLWQVQHQLMVSGAEMAHLFVFDGEQGIIQEIQPEPERWVQLHAGWDGFQAYLDSDTAPALQENDVVIRLDGEWHHAAERYRAAKQAQDRITDELANAKKSLVDLCQNDSQRGHGVRVTRSGATSRVTIYQVEETCC